MTNGYEQSITKSEKHSKLQHITTLQHTISYTILDYLLSARHALQMSWSVEGSKRRDELNNEHTLQGQGIRTSLELRSYYTTDLNYMQGLNGYPVISPR